MRNTKPYAISILSVAIGGFDSTTTEFRSAYSTSLPRLDSFMATTSCHERVSCRKNYTAVLENGKRFDL